jgi:hypothetical protein
MSTAPLTPIEELGDALFGAALVFALTWGVQMLARSAERQRLSAYLATIPVVPEP